MLVCVYESGNGHEPQFNEKEFDCPECGSSNLSLILYDGAWEGDILCEDCGSVLRLEIQGG